MEPEFYDPTLHMYRDPPREPCMAVLRFLRWLGERNALEHEVYGDPSGPYAEEDTGRAEDVKELLASYSQDGEDD